MWRVKCLDFQLAQGLIISYCSDFFTFVLIFVISYLSYYISLIFAMNFHGLNIWSLRSFPLFAVELKKWNNNVHTDFHRDPPPHNMHGFNMSNMGLRHDEQGGGHMSQIILSKNCSYVPEQDPYFAPKYPFPISASMRALLALPERCLSKTSKSFIGMRNSAPPDNFLPLQWVSTFY